MTLLDFEELCAYWADHPPTHVMVAAYLGVKPKDQPPQIQAIAAAGQVDIVAQTLAELGPLASGLIERDVHEGLGKPILDFAELSARANTRQGVNG